MPTSRSAERPSLSIVIPAYNEEKRLPATLEKVVAYFSPGAYPQIEVLIVDDGSRDATVAISQEAARRHARPDLRFRVLENPGNRGKGYSVRHGMLEATCEWALFSDADLSSPIEEVEKLLHAVTTNGADAAIGSRAIDRSLIGTHQPLSRELAGRSFNLFVRLVARLNFADTQCGFKLFSRKAVNLIFRRQLLDRFGFDVELLYIARRGGLKTVEVPVRWNDVEGTKVSLLGGLDAFADVMRVRGNALRGRYRF